MAPSNLVGRSFILSLIQGLLRVRIQKTRTRLESHERFSDTRILETQNEKLQSHLPNAGIVVLEVLVIELLPLMSPRGFLKLGVIEDIEKFCANKHSNVILSPIRVSRWKAMSQLLNPGP